MGDGVAKLRRRGKVGGGQKRRRGCAKERKQIVFISIFKFNFLFKKSQKQPEFKFFPNFFYFYLEMKLVSG